VVDVDVLIVGAGLSGIGLAHELKTRVPSVTFELVEARGATGGTWDLFRYPGIRSDSDLYTFGFRFRPWRSSKAIADGASILDYLRATLADSDNDRHVRLHHRVLSANWSSRLARWTVEIERTDTGERLIRTARWLFSAAGYYRYDGGYTPELPGLADFAGEVVHPQDWPAALDLAGRKVVIIGSGATAVTLVPALAAQGARVTMLQRTPSYVLPLPSEDAAALRLRRLFGDRVGHALARSKNVAMQRVLWLFARSMPQRTRAFIRSVIARKLPAGYPVDVHFNPPYNPWDQRLCFDPDGRFFRAIRGGAADVVTDRIAGFTPGGVTLASGGHLDAEVVITATGLRVLPFGGIALRVDDEPVDLHDHVAYRGIMLDGIPNFAYAIGYTNASWTLKIGLTCEYFVRLLKHMRRHDYDSVEAHLDAEVGTRPLLDFRSGYVQRAIAELPRQGERSPWRVSMNYYADARTLRWSPIRDRRLRFSRQVETLATAPDDGGQGGARARRPYTVRLD
jgi:monooxygenase